MNHEFSQMLNLRVMDNGSKRHVLKKMEAGVQQLGEPRLIHLHAVAMAGVEAASQVNLRWLNQKALSETSRREARALDAVVDRQLSGLYTLVLTWAELPVGTPFSEGARRVVDALFTRGVFPYTSLPYDEQHDQVTTLVGTLRSDYSAELNAIQLMPVVDGLDSVNQDYGQALDLNTVRISFEKVTEVRQSADDAFHKFLLALIGGLVDQPDTLEGLLDPLRIQQARLAEYYKRHKTPPTVDQDTGELAEPADAPDAEPVI